MSQVKNLRAMFENKDDLSPPERGRSPGISESKKQDDIEKDGRIGLKRDESDEASTSPRRPGPDATDDRKNNTGDQGRETILFKEVLNTSTKKSSHLDTAVERTSDGRGAIAEGTAAEISETITPHPRRERDIGLQGVDMREGFRPSHANETKAGEESNALTKVDCHPPLLSATSTDNSTGGNDARSSVKPRSMSNEPKATTRKKSESTGLSLQGKAPRQRRSVDIRHQNSKTNISNKPKSTAEPGRLPSSLKTPTAATVSKVHGPQSSHQERPGANATVSTSIHPSSKPGSRSQSSNAVDKKRSPSASSLRPSLGLPPKKLSASTVTSKRLPSNIDEGFLARMTRPTRSSASKLVDKVSIPPSISLTQSLAERKDVLSDRSSARSVSSGRSLPGKVPTLERPDRYPLSNVKGAQVVQATKYSEKTTIDHDHERLGAGVDASKATNIERASEDAPKIVLSNDSIPVIISTNNTASNCSEMYQSKNLDKSRRQSCVLELESISASNDGVSHSNRNAEDTLSEALTPLILPDKIASDDGDVLALISAQKSPSDEVSAPEADVENTGVK
ncbi:hypothetical protein E4U17_007705 [Claviceps sp. LM77 group G4]|nr:hypothetical protein E4U17_007705 [Claviceps sp. LM77 group G4]KAG6056252.1 hypothetical protein E4U33_007727 [Claviceps sp. LM78 group G4]KAG6069537.1 hypothetical protein E4U16_007621 [Claviceps sp. LM84 group G4]